MELRVDLCTNCQKAQGLLAHTRELHFDLLIVDKLGVVGTELERGEMLSLKREAFKVAGDMSTAIKLLVDYALRNARVLDAYQFSSSNEILASILEFLLDLCEEGEIGAISFYLHQLRHIHIRMIPAKDAVELMRAELMKDVLITSTHLGLELIWDLIADLEESFEDPNNASPLCRARRFTVLQFSSALQKELALLNELGSDVLSRAGEGISRAVRIPDNKGHVFRSKERTPVLLLYEIIRPEIPDEEHENESLMNEERSDDIDEEEKEDKDNLGTNS